MSDTATTPEDTTASTPINWKVALHQLKLRNMSFSMQLPTDSMCVTAHIEEAAINSAQTNLKNQYYDLKKPLLSGTSANYNTETTQPTENFDASHIAVQDTRTALDSLLYKGRDMDTVIREFTMNKRSGLSVTALTGRAYLSDPIVYVPSLELNIPHSEIDLSIHTYWELVDIPVTGRLSVRLNAYIDKEDAMLFAGALPEGFKETYPFHPLITCVGTDDDLEEM